jgi:hypothetical protein
MSLDLSERPWYLENSAAAARRMEKTLDIRHLGISALENGFKIWGNIPYL